MCCIFSRLRDVRFQKKTTGIKVAAVLLCVGLTQLYSVTYVGNIFSQIPSFYQPDPKQDTCPDVSRGMMKGRWIPRPLTAHERVEITAFVKTVRRHMGLPVSLQRSDGKCGDLSYEHLMYYRAMCNPDGATPCCYNGTCVNLPSAECHCQNCFDLRTRIHAEYSTWAPADPRCQVKNFTAREACDLLEGETITVVGDSYMRHLYTALLLVLSNNAYDGALKKGIPQAIHDSCTGMYVFTEKECSKYLQLLTELCGGRVKLRFLFFHNIASAKQIQEYTAAYLLDKTKHTLIVGIGVHDSFEYNSVFKEYIYPVIERITHSKNARFRLIWASTHRFALFKSPLYPGQSEKRLKAFNKNMAQLLGKYNVPIFDTYNLTSGVISQDGGHFGIGINVKKVQLFLNFYLALRK